ncbi:hypothetical protein ACFSMW_20130 [Virgibacillus halophilus]
MKPITKEKRKGIIVMDGMIIVQKSKYVVIAKTNQPSTSKKLDKNSLNAPMFIDLS